MKLGEQIKHYRKRSGYSMEELGALLGVSRQTVFRYESGAIENVPREKIKKMAGLFGISEAKLFVVPITTNLLSESSFAMSELDFARKKHIPILNLIKTSD